MHLHPTTHITLLERLGDDRDAAAWREFYDRYGNLIRAFARRQGLQAADCDDVIQEVLLGLRQSLRGRRFDPARGKFRNYLKSIVMRAIFRRFRQKAGGGRQLDMESRSEVPAEDPAGEQIWEDEWREYHLRQAMRVIEVEFNPADRAAFDSYVVDGRDARQTAERLGLSVDQVYQAKSRILKRLSEIIAEQVREEG